MKNLLWASIAFITYTSAFGDSWGDNQFVSQTEAPNLEQNMSIATLRPVDLESKTTRRFKHLGLAIAKQSSWLGTRASYGWPMPTENTSLGIYGDYAWDRSKNKKIGAGIESISYFGDEEQTGFFLKGCVGVGRGVLETNRYSGHSGNKNYSKLTSKIRPGTEATKRTKSSQTMNFLNAEFGIGYSININNLFTLNLLTAVNFEILQSRNRKAATLEFGTTW